MDDDLPFDDDEQEGDLVLDEPENAIQVPPQDAAKDVAFLKQALKILSRKLTAEKESLDKLDQLKASRAVQNDIGELDEAMPRVLDDHGIAGLSERQRRLARTAVPMLVKNTKASQGTARGIGHEDWAEQAGIEAAYIDAYLPRQLDEQLAVVQ